MRRPDDVVEVDAMDEMEVEEYEEYMETSDRLELVRVSCTSEAPSSTSAPMDDSRESRPPERLLSRSRLLGGTSWTCRFNGWLLFAGGGRTMINV